MDPRHRGPLCLTARLEYSSELLVADYRAFRVATTLPCRRCRYDLRGLAADRECPECGLEVLESVAASVDPELALLPPLTRPRLTGVSLLVLATALACAAVGTSVSAAALVLSRLPPSGWYSSLVNVFPPSAPSRLLPIPPFALLVAIIAGATLVLASRSIQSRGPGRVTGRSNLTLLFGLAAWAVASWGLPELKHLAMVGFIAMVTLAGLGPLVSELGQRSRAYRRAAHAQQAIGPLTASMAIGVLAVLVTELTGPWIGADLVHLLRLLATVALAMTNVGFLYLVVNAVWIWRSLWGWQPLLERVLVTDGTGGGSTGDEAKTGLGNSES